MRLPRPWRRRRQSKERVAEARQRLADAKAQRPRAEELAHVIRQERIRNRFGENAKSIFQGR